MLPALAMYLPTKSSVCNWIVTDQGAPCPLWADSCLSTELCSNGHFFKKSLS